MKGTIRMSNETDAVLLGQEREQETPEEEGGPVVDVQTAFIVFLTKEGTFAASTDINLPIVPERVATGNDMLLGCSSVRDEIIVQNTAAVTAQMTVNAQMQLAQQAMQARQNQDILARLPQGLAR